ncbi:hypothetical protein PVK06_001578 [Gossypium arboreum]|uniref:Uncharacterized protein n=1 Tax=Gossypium arboreum TaxID=29729 RepID=A0ABR0R1H4_GOSAR|nr:hypothetical protein PVK06_001578 [Gossypium arboreum]
MLMYQWEDAVRFWNSKKREGRERVRTTSRQKQKFTHIARSKSFTCELSSGKKVERLQLFDIIHRKKDGSPMTTEVAEFMEKLKDKRKKYEAIASSDSSVSLDGIDNQTIIEVLGPETASREVEAQRKYEELQLQLKVEAAAREAEASRKYDELQLQL